jgi:predicted Ser/Thr protein kinase
MQKQLEDLVRTMNQLSREHAQLEAGARARGRTDSAEYYGGKSGAYGLAAKWVQEILADATWMDSHIDDSVILDHPGDRGR